MGNANGGIMRNEKITTHAFNIEEAVKYGVEKAILLYNIRFWLEKNKANMSNARDGFYWTYNSSAAFSRLFPYLPEQSIRRWMTELEKKGVLLSSQKYNRTAFDKTKWYTIPSEYRIAQSDQSVAHNEQSTVQDEQSIDQNERTIPDINTDVTTDVTHISKKRYGEFKNVHLTDDEHSKLAERMGVERLEDGINILDSYIEQKGKRYKSHFAVMKEGGWVWERVHKDKPAPVKADYSNGF
jgi:hypothetical protein